MRIFLIYAGFIPFFLAAALFIFGYEGAFSKDMWLYIVQIYGGIILSFLSGIQWGLTFQKDIAPSYKDYILPLWSNIIALAAFFALIHAQEKVTLSVLIFGFMLQLLADMHFSRQGFYEKSYIKHRLIITILVVTSLLLVLRNVM